MATAAAARIRRMRGPVALAAALVVATLLLLAALAVPLATRAATAPAATAPAPATPTARPAPNTLTDSQLATEAQQLDARATAIGQQLLDSDARATAIGQDRDAAAALLARYLADTYKSATTTGTTGEQLFLAGSLTEAIDRIQVAGTVGRYRRGILRDLDTAATQLDLQRVDHARLVTELSGVQRRLLLVQTEQQRRAQLRADRAADRRAAQEAAAAKRAREAQAANAALAASAASVAGTLVGDGSSPTTTAFAPPGSAPSAQLIDAYLASKQSPMAGQGAAFMASAARWRVDPRLLVAIAGAESNFGQVTCGPNNAWGWACPNDPADFATWAAGIDTVTSGLRRYYLDEGRTSVSLIQQKYCPVGAANDPTGLNSHWATNVTRFLVELGGNPLNVGPGPSGPGALGLPGFGIFD